MTNRPPEDTSRTGGHEASDPGPTADGPLGGPAATSSMPPRQRLSRHPPPALHRRPAVIWGTVALAALVLGLFFFGDFMYPNALVVRPRAQPSASPQGPGSPAADAAAESQ
jgi:hypothetical protein